MPSDAAEHAERHAFGEQLAADAATGPHPG